MLRACKSLALWCCPSRIGPAKVSHFTQRSACPHLAKATVQAGHWLQLEAAPAVNEHIEAWISSQVADPRLW